MEVGAVKQAFNNEVILLKKKLNQAKIQIIHKLTRKAKQLVEKKAPEPLKEKLKRKAESAVKEVLIIKKIKPKDVAKFIVTHEGDLKTYLNKPIVDNDKACARLLLHKALQDKYEFIRGRFSNVPIQDLFMSRLERKKMKKEEKEKQKNKKKGKNNKVVNSEGDWNVEDINVGDQSKLSDSNADLTDDDEEIEQNVPPTGDEESQDDESDQSEDEKESDGNENSLNQDEVDDSGSEADAAANGEPEIEETAKFVTTTPKLKVNANKLQEQLSVKDKPSKNELNDKRKEVKKNPDKKQKDVNKNKNFNEKLQQRKLKKDSVEPVVGNKIVDPFFITSTGENYMSVVEPRGPDEVKDEHKQGNRKLRRAAMFGHVPNFKLRQNNYRDDNRFNNQNGSDRNNKLNNRQELHDRKPFRNDFNDSKQFKNDFNDRKRFNDESNDEKPEKLHPSWEAKKKKSGILPFEGKKIVFD